jgi:hypothetical protein
MSWRRHAQVAGRAAASQPPTRAERLVGLVSDRCAASASRIVKIFKLASLLEVTLLPAPALQLVFRPTITDTHRQHTR